MKKVLLIILLLVFPIVTASEHCVEAYEGMIVKKNTKLCPDSYEVRNGISVGADNVILDCQTAILKGVGNAEGITIENVTNVTVKNCNVVNYNVGIYLKNAKFSHVHDNALLKNMVGVRLYQSFENRVENNADKSRTKAVGAIASKYNIVWLTNKNIEKGFCEENLCNTRGSMNPCADNDYYCSPSCSWENDNDCPKPQQSETKQQEKNSRTKQLLEQAEKALTKNTTAKIVAGEKAKKRLAWPAQALVYFFTYLIGFVMVQRYLFSHKK